MVCAHGTAPDHLLLQPGGVLVMSGSGTGMSGTGHGRSAAAAGGEGQAIAQAQVEAGEAATIALYIKAGLRTAQPL